MDEQTSLVEDKKEKVKHFATLHICFLRYVNLLRYWAFVAVWLAALRQISRPYTVVCKLNYWFLTGYILDKYSIALQI